MASKLESQKDLIAKKLGDGISINALAKELTAAGVTTTPQNLGRWIQRRIARLQSRQELVDQLAAGQNQATSPN